MLQYTKQKVHEGYNAPINVKPAGGGGGGGQGMGDFTFLKNLPSNSLPMGKSFQSNATKFPHPGLHIAVKFPKAGPNKGTIEISPNKTLQSLFMNVVASPKIHVPITTAVIPLNHSIHVTLRRIEKPLGESPHFVSLNVPFLVKGRKKVSFTACHSG